MTSTEQNFIQTLERAVMHAARQLAARAQATDGCAMTPGRGPDFGGVETIAEAEAAIARRERAMEFVGAFNAIRADIHATAIEKGWWDAPRTEGEIIALIHSELSEGLEALREGKERDERVPEFKGIEVELADTLIRIMDYAARHGYRVAEALVAKAEVNRMRERRHGGKAF